MGCIEICVKDCNKLQELKYAHGSASIGGLPNDTIRRNFGYVDVTGRLSRDFDSSNGIFTAGKDGIYQFFYYVTFQNQAMANKRNDG